MESLTPKGPSPIEQVARLCLTAGMGLNEAVLAFKTHLLMQALREHQGNVCRVARMIGHHRNTVSRIIEQLKLREFARSCRPERTHKSGPRKPALLLYADNRLDQSRVA